MKNAGNQVRLLEGSEVARVGNLVVLSAIAAIANLLGEEAHVRRRRPLVFARGDDAAGNAQGARRRNGVGTRGEALLHGDHRGGRDHLHHLAGFGDFLWPAAMGGGAEESFEIGFDELGGAALANLRDVLLAFGTGGVGVALRFRRAEGEGLDAVGRGAPNFIERVAANRAAGEERLAEAEVIEEACGVGSELLDGDGAFASLRLAVSAQVRNDEAVFRGQVVGDGNPEAVIEGRRVEENHARALAERGVKEF